MDIKIELTRQEINDLQSYCKLNNFDVSEIIKKSFSTGFRIEKYGLLNNSPVSNKEPPIEIIKEVIKEIIKEVPVEVIKEVIKEVPVEVIKEVPVEVIKEVKVEVIKEVPIEISKEVPIEVIREVIVESVNDCEKQKKQLLSLQETIKNLRESFLDLTKKLEICEAQKNVQHNQQLNSGVVYLKDSNLDNKLY
jgi:hypothetical protein